MVHLLRAVLILALLAPYARGPLCGTGSHAHHHGDATAHALADAGGEAPDGSAECHAVMRCGATVVATLTPAVAEAGPTPATVAAVRRVEADRSTPSRTPEAPPPRTG